MISSNRDWGTASLPGQVALNSIPSKAEDRRTWVQNLIWGHYIWDLNQCGGDSMMCERVIRRIVRQSVDKFLCTSILSTIHADQNYEPKMSPSIAMPSLHLCKRYMRPRLSHQHFITHLEDEITESYYDSTKCNRIAVAHRSRRVKAYRRAAYYRLVTLLQTS